MRSIILQLVLGLQDSVDDSTIQISVIAVICFTAGYLFPRFGSAKRHLPATILDACGDFAYRVTTVLFVPAFLLALSSESRAALDYGSSGPMPRALQALLYTHLFSALCALARPIPRSRDGGEFGLRPLC